MLIRLRSRDGLERVQVDDKATLTGLKLAIHQHLNIPLEDMVLSKHPDLLTTKDPRKFTDLADQNATLAALGVQHGDLIFLLYHFERQVEPVYKKSVFETREFGAKVTVEDVMAKQVRIERQEQPHVESVSFDRGAANMFQQYVQAALAFSIMRGGLLYGTRDEAGNVKVEAVYEPPQEGNATDLIMQTHTPEREQVDFLASQLGLTCVGIIYSQSDKSRDYIASTAEVLLMATQQAEIGEYCVTVAVSFDAGEEGGQVHFEAFQLSDLSVRLFKEGWLQPTQPEGNPGVTRMHNPREPDVKDPVIVAGRDVSEVDNDWFLCPVKILDHQGPLLSSFPVENRLLPQGKPEFRDHMKRHASRPYVERLSDLHALLWLSRQPNLDAHDVALLAEAVREQKPVMEGYRMIIDSIAGL